MDTFRFFCLALLGCYSIFWLECHMPAKKLFPGGSAFWALLLTRFSTSLMSPQFPVFLHPRPHFRSHLHMAPHLPHSSGCSQMTRRFLQGRKPIQLVLALYSLFIPANQIILLISIMRATTSRTTSSKRAYVYPLFDISVFQPWSFNFIWFVTWCLKPIFLAV